MCNVYVPWRFEELPSAVQPRVIVPTHISIQADSLFLLYTHASIFLDDLCFHFLYSLKRKIRPFDLFKPGDFNKPTADCQLATRVHDQEISVFM